MRLKKKEFCSLRQGGRSVAEYVEVFNKLARYAPDDVRDDAARQEKFLEGLNDELGVQLTVATFANCQGLIDKAIVLEGKQQAIENRKRKYNNNNGDKYNSGPQQKPHNSYGGNGVITMDITTMVGMTMFTMEDTTIMVGMVTTIMATTTTMVTGMAMAMAMGGTMGMEEAMEP